jgi:DNA polymerase III sliding clamp (beta) subunit (PCNA family)
MAVYGFCPYGTFPDITDLLNTGENFDSIYVDADAMRYAVDQTFGILDMVDYKGAILEFNESRFSIGATNPDTGEFSPYEVPYKSDVSGVKLETAFNPDYLLKALAGTKTGDEVNIMVPRDSNNPALIIYQDQTTVIMPMRMD